MSILTRTIKLKLKYILAVRNVRNVFPLGKFMFPYLNLFVISRQAADKEMHQEVSENIRTYIYLGFTNGTTCLFLSFKESPLSAIPEVPAGDFKH